MKYNSVSFDRAVRWRMGSSKVSMGGCEMSVLNVE
jgi:hypothetical protein